MKAHIVVVEDDDHMQNSLTSGLKNVGWQVFGYPYRNIDLATVQQHHPDLIILDFNVQDGGIGWEFLQILKMEKKKRQSNKIGFGLLLLMTTRCYVRV